MCPAPHAPPHTSPERNQRGRLSPQATDNAAGGLGPQAGPARPRGAGGSDPTSSLGPAPPGLTAVLGMGFALGLARLMLSPEQLPGKATRAAERHCPWGAEGAGGWRSSQPLLLPVAHKTLKVIHLPADNVENTGRQDSRTRPQHVRRPLLGSF